MRKFSLIASAVLLMLPMTLMADQLSIGGPSTGTVTYTSNGDSSTLGLGWTTLTDGSTFTLTGGTIQDTGAYSFAATSGIVLTSAGGGVFNVTTAVPTSFTYSSTTDPDKLSGTIGWTYVVDGSPTPTLHGNLLVSSSSGDARFTSAFIAGDGYLVDFNISGSCAFSPCTLNNLVTLSKGSTMSGPISAGQVVAEPRAAALLGFGLLCLIGLRRKLALAS